MNQNRKAFITAEITGTVYGSGMSPYLPVMPQQMIDEAVRSYEAGASIAHVHTRSPSTGEPDADIARTLEIVGGIQRRCDMIVCVGSCGSQTASFEERLAPVSKLQPEMADCNIDSMNFAISDVSERILDGYGWRKPYLRETGGCALTNACANMEMFVRAMNTNETRPQFEIHDPSMLNTVACFVKSGIVRPPVYLQFVLGVQGGISASVKNLLFLKETADLLLGVDGYIWCAAAVGRHQLPMAATALAMGGNVRVGLGDSLYLRAHVLAQSNAEQVTAVRSIADAMDIELAVPSEVRSMLGLKGSDRVVLT
ncbi:3-keto-5-aminohexanoate cleavage protein [Oscillibacter sp. GMB15532]|uniref:3-keto-5-aminohexanoate cleavage protein n=1 Tax=Oscillibacter sp. GMB15532 TaxID=3230022 RepID=UPI0034E02E23